MDRARRALGQVAAQFGTVSDTTDTEVRVITSDGLQLTLSYDPGNYIFSRVYNLTVTARLPEGSPLPVARLVHRGAQGPRFVSVNGADSAALAELNRVVAPHLSGIDVYASRIDGSSSKRSITVTPLGGSYVWVLIPPVFKSTAFPPGEPERILALIRAVRGITPIPATTNDLPPTVNAPAPTRKDAP